jgi:acylphosphatase
VAGRRILVSGKVQGVFYRGWTERQAQALGLSGWVRNLDDGDVEILAIGPDATIDELVRRCWQGPRAAVVSEVRTEPADDEPIESFRQRR